MRIVEQSAKSQSKILFHNHTVLWKGVSIIFWAIFRAIWIGCPEWRVRLYNEKREAKLFCRQLI